MILWSSSPRLLGRQVADLGWLGHLAGRPIVGDTRTVHCYDRGATIVALRIAARQRSASFCIHEFRSRGRQELCVGHILIARAGLDSGARPTTIMGLKVLRQY
eukprot:1757024-Pleurochrysis_carterae.AAC.1